MERRRLALLSPHGSNRLEGKTAIISAMRKDRKLGLADLAS